MALTKNGLKEVMLSATYMHTSCQEPLTALGNAIAEYIVSNAQLTFTWVATNTVPPNDTENISTTGEILTCPIVLTPSEAKVPVEGLVHLATEIVAGIRAGTFNITAGGWSTTPQLLSDCPDFTLTIDGTDSRDSAFDQLATQIVNQIQAYQPGTPVPGTHGTYNGQSTFCTIS